jgi:hypothetical protein
MKGIVGDYAIRRQYAADGLTLTEAAAQLGITRQRALSVGAQAWAGVCGASGGQSHRSSWKARA